MANNIPIEKMRHFDAFLNILMSKSQFYYKLVSQHG
jgi:hypothetical protein